MSSAAEREIREAVVVRLRELLPTARIVHELNVAGQGSNRIDVAAITSTSIIGIEVKSERDKLDRLTSQMKAFGACCHEVIVAAHVKHFKPWREDWWSERTPDVLHLDHPDFFGNRYRHAAVWPYPRPLVSYDPIGSIAPWSLRRDLGHSLPVAQPRAYSLLDMLWAAELLAECARHRLPANTRSHRSHMIVSLAWNLSGKQVAEAVCRQLRGRTFAEADAPVFEVAA